MMRDNIITEKRVHTCESQVGLHSITDPEIPENDYISRLPADKSSQLNLGSSDIYGELLNSLSEKYVNTPYTIPSKNNVNSTVRNNRESVERNQIEGVMSPPLSFEVNELPFLRCYWFGDIDCQTHRIITWITNESLAFMRHKTHTFISVSFKVSPHLFTSV
ncbi:hypothetical protein RF11_11291 [Thelohanellus kitauei]|uniref:Uncharacterized protein n=1 Tax=Thelohanellus kitauei TaxID=669202 RepID=A0A0C2MHQ4_THEKT|nr:hypothetical protein RF11_11291 [Thelohanellus kitauei]